MGRDSNLTPEIQDAIDELSSFPSVVDFNIIENNAEGWVKVISTWIISLPRKYVKKGISDTGVKDTELVTWYFPLLYPSFAPKIRLRKDFPSNLPHIYPHQIGELVPPCVSDIPLSELLHSEGMGGILDAVNSWLIDAASNELNDPIQGWEPVRRNDFFGSIIADTLSIREDICKKNKTVLFYQANFMTYGNSYIYGMINKKLMGHANTALNRIQVGTTSNDIHSTPVILFASPGIVDKYFAETVLNLSDFISLSEECGLTDIAPLRLKYVSDRIVKSNHASHKLLVNDFFIILAIKRPYPLMGNISNIELLTYRVEAKIDSSGKFKLDSPCIPISTQETCSKTLLKAVSGLNTEKEIPLTMVGCGSLGSKLTLHLAKTGNYSFQLIDNETMSMHNNARHALIETSFAELYKPKAELLDKKLKSLGLKSLVINKDFRLINKEKTFKIHRAGGYIIDSTASLAVRHDLLNMDLEPSCRFIQTYLLNKSRLGVIAIEGEDRNPRVDDLNAMMYQKGIDNKSIGTSVYKFDGAQRQQFADGCGSFTTKMTDIDISLPSSAIASKLHKYCISEEQPSTGELLMCNVDEDGNLNWSHTNMDKTLTFEVAEGYPWKVRVLASVAKEIEIQAQRYSGKENGGVLLGQFDMFTKTIHISGLLDAPPDSKRTATKFVLGTEGLEDCIINIAKNSEGRITFFGTWHNHINNEPVSQLDIDTFTKLQTQTTLPIVMLVYKGGRIERIVQ